MDIKVTNTNKKVARARAGYTFPPNDSVIIRGIDPKSKDYFAIKVVKDLVIEKLKEEEVDPIENELNEKNMTELRKMASDLEIKNYTEYKKNELIAKIIAKMKE